MGNYQVRFLEDGVGSNPTLLFDISPILANMTLDGLEKLFLAEYPKRRHPNKSKTWIINNIGNRMLHESGTSKQKETVYCFYQKPESIDIFI
jgi:hypothetical protein